MPQHALVVILKTNPDGVPEGFVFYHPPVKSYIFDNTGVNNIKDMSYKQETKETSRDIIWKSVVETLITNRKDSLILNEEYIRKLWYFVFHETLIPHNLVNEVDEKYLADWLDYSKQTYNYEKKVSELKVAYLCGPEPENDLDHLIGLGFRIENIYAFESDNKIFDSAIAAIKNKYQNLKIFNGKIDEFIKSTFVKFDVVYLDFTTPLFSRSSKIFKSVITLFEHRALTDLSSLIVNTTFPRSIQVVNMTAMPFRNL